MPIGKSKETRRQALEKVERHTGKRPAGLNTRPVPKGMHYLSEMYWDLKRSAERITYCEIDAWARLTNQELEAQEVRVIMAMEAVVARIQGEVAS